MAAAPTWADLLANVPVPLATWSVAPAKGQTSFYYVRIRQRNGQMAWASPIWVRVP